MTITCHLVGVEVLVRRKRVLKLFLAVPMKRQKRSVQLRLHHGNSVALALSSSFQYDQQGAVGFRHFLSIIKSVKQQPYYLKL